MENNKVFDVELALDSDLIMQARQERKFIDTDAGVLTPKEVCDLLRDGTAVKANNELITEDTLFTEIYAKIRALEKERDLLRVRCANASSDDPEAAMQWLTVKETKRFSDYKDPVDYLKWDTDLSDFMCGTDRKVGYIEDLRVFVRAIEKSFYNEIYCIVEIDVGAHEPEPRKVKVVEVLSYNRCMMFYNELKDFKEQYPKEFNDCILWRYSSVWDYLSIKCSNETVPVAEIKECSSFSE